MEVDYNFPRRSFSSKKSARAKILTEWKTTLRMKKTATLNSAKVKSATLIAHYQTVQHQTIVQH